MANSVTVPGGSSTVSVPPAPAVAPAGSDPWTVEYEIDFAAESSHDFTGGVAVSLTNNSKTVTWTPEEEAGAPTTFGLDGSTGLQIFATSQARKWWNGYTTAPLVSAKIEDMMDGFSRSDTVCLQVHMDSSADVSANYHSYGLALWDGTLNDGTGFVQTRRIFDSSAKTGFIRDSTQDNISDATQRDFFEIVWLPCDGQVLSAGTFSGSFPDPLATTTYRSYTSTDRAGYGTGPSAAPTWRIPHSDGRFAIFSQSENTGSTLEVTAYKMRVLRRNNS